MTFSYDSSGRTVTFYAANAGGAHNRGVENALNWTATSNLHLQLSATFLQAEISITTNLGNGIVLPEGTRIPGAPRWSASELAIYHWNVDYRPYVSASAHFISGAQSGFPGARTPGLSLPIMNYGTVALRSGISLNHFDFSLYVDNIADRRGVTAAYYSGAGADPNADRVFTSGRGLSACASTGICSRELAARR